MNAFIKTFSLAIAYLITINQLNAQCPPGDVAFQSKEDLDNFAINFPNCTELSGSVSISEPDRWITDRTIKNLKGLDNIRSIGGNLHIIFTSLTEGLTGLENLETIKGDLTLDKNGSIKNFAGLNKLKSIGGDLHLEENSLSDLTGLDSLSTINGSLIIYFNTKLQSISGLENIDSIGGNLNISNNYFLKNLNGLNNIKTVVGDVRINQDLEDMTGLNSLQSIGKDLSIYGSTDLLSLSGLESLTFVGEDFWMSWDDEKFENDTIPLIDISALSNLIEVGGGLNISNTEKLGNLHGLHNLTSVGSSLILSNNKALTNISGFENLASVGGSLRISDNDSLVGISGFKNLTTVEGWFQITNNNKLKDVTGFSNLQSTGDYFFLKENSSLESVTGFKNLNIITRELSITENNLLSDITDFSNIISLRRLSIIDNPMLNNCNISSICNFLLNGGGFTIRGNAEGCVNKDEILKNCNSLAMVKSEIYYDINQNKQQDGDEPLLSFGNVTVNPGNINIVPNQQLGYGVYFLIPNTYTFKFNEKSTNNWYETTAASYTINLTEGVQENVSFGIFPNKIVSDMHTFINYSNTRCNDTIQFTVSAKNMGTTFTSGTLWFEADNSVVSTKFIDEPDTLIKEYVYGWHYNKLAPSQTVNKNVLLKMPSVTNFDLGGPLYFKSYTTFTDENGEAETEDKINDTELRCSFDPNDKLVQPNRKCNYTLMDEYLTYTIRFQNTGNDEAYRVVITDQLDANLDFSTFNLIGSSHFDILNTTINEAGKLNFEFNNIFLPDSSTNFEGSQGYVSYLIKAKTGLPGNTVIANTSYIYFDFNPPVITNTTENLMVVEIPEITCFGEEEQEDTNIEHSTISIYPNPSNGNFKIDVGFSPFDEAYFSLYNIAGCQVMPKTYIAANRQSFTYPNLPIGLYYVNVIVDEKVIRKKLMLAN